MQYVAYYRVSTQKQGVSGLGLEAQQAAVGDYLKTHGGTVLESFTEVKSGKKDDRQELHKALRRCRLTGAKLLIAKLDRLSRSRRFLFELMDSATDFVCADMPEANSLTVGFMACLAEYESQMISERTKAALKASKARGVKLGNPDLHLYRNTDTTAATQARVDTAKGRSKDLKAVISEFKQEAGSNGLSLRQIASKLNNAGYKTARGCAFQAATVQRTLR